MSSLNSHNKSLISIDPEAVGHYELIKHNMLQACNV